MKSAVVPGPARRVKELRPLRVEASPWQLEEAPLAAWTQRYPDAAMALSAWMSTYPDAADALIVHDFAYPEQTRLLGLWAITHPYESAGARVAVDPQWASLQPIRANFPEALEAFAGWCRSAPAGCEELVSHVRGIAWVGNKLRRSKGLRRNESRP